MTQEQKGDIWNLMLNDGAENKQNETPQKKRTRGKDKKPRKKDGYLTESFKSRTREMASKSPIIQANRETTENPSSEYNANTLTFMMEIAPTEELDKNDVAEMKRRFSHYIDTCAKYGKKVSNQAAYLAIGITKEDVYDWTTRTSANPERTHFIKNVQQFCSVFRESVMQDGKLNPVVGIFWQKNYDGLRDQTELAIAPVNPLGEGKSAEELAKKYSEDAYIDAEEQKALPDPQKDKNSN